jgi:NMD protein affecting ribosome stability and mRNA decay
MKCKNCSWNTEDFGASTDSLTIERCRHCGYISVEDTIIKPILQIVTEEEI